MNLKCCPDIKQDYKSGVLQRIPVEVRPTEPPDRPKACSELPVDRPPGVYTIYPDSSNSFDVYCEDGWTIFQRHEKVGYHFYKKWKEYKTGFGDLNHDHWLGNDKLHILTSKNGTCGRKLKVVLSDFDDVEVSGVFHIFHVGDEFSKYMMFRGEFSSRGLHSHSMENGKKFSTIDQDNDYIKGYSCARNRLAGWWFDGCGDACLNGPIRKHARKTWTTMHWHSFRRANSLKKTVMMLK